MEIDISKIVADSGVRRTQNGRHVGADALPWCVLEATGTARLRVSPRYCTKLAMCG